MGFIPHPELSAKDLPLNTLSALLAGQDFWHTTEIQERGLGSVRFSDGPNGVRGEDWVNGAPSAAIPCATGLGASFDRNLMHQLAELLAQQCHEKGVHALLAPTMNIHRYARCGRNFESFSEDPYLTGALATEYVKGLQKHGIAATPKHFLANEAENGRRWSNSVIDEKALREIYLEPFRMVVQDAHPWALMTAYNSVNGSFCSESSHLLSILRAEWGFAGVVISDWFGTYSSAPALEAGLDLELPGPSKFRTEAALRSALEEGQVTRGRLEASAGHVLRFLEKTRRVGAPGSAPATKAPRPDYAADEASERLLVAAAEKTMVLLKNDGAALPVTRAAAAAAQPRVVVFGEHARKPSLFGGGSASLKVPETTPAPWDAIRGHFPGAVCSAGVRTDRLVKTPGAQCLKTGPIRLSWYNGTEVCSEKCFVAEEVQDTMYMLVEAAPKGLVDRSDFCTTMGFSFSPPRSESYDISICGPGDAVCTINGEVVLDVRRGLDVSTEDFLFDRSKLEVRRDAPLLLEAGSSYDVQITSWSSKHQAENVNREFFIQGCRFGFEPSRDDELALALAKRDAAQADVAIVFAGTGPEWESEGFDRVNMQLPRRQNELIEAVASSCGGRTIVVVNAGSPIDMSPWIGQVDAVIQAWFPGMGYAQGLLNLLVGDASPCARLPTTFWDKVDDYPAGHVEALMAPNKDIHYREGALVGYRQPSSRLPRPRFAFGHGLSYTRFHYEVSGPRWVEVDSRQGVDVQVKIFNIGQRPASETVLLFLQPLQTDGSMNEVELKAFGKTDLLGPGRHQTLELKLSQQSLSHWDVGLGAWRVGRGIYQVLFAGPRGVGDWLGVGQCLLNVT